MDVLCFASRKGGSGKSTLVAHLSAHASRPSRRCLLIDADSQGSLTLWHKLRGTGEPALKNGARGVADVVEAARRDNTESPFVTQAREMISRLNVPVWSGQITNRANYALSLASGEGVREFEAQSQAATEIGRLWLAIDRSVKAIHGAYQAAGAMHRVAA